MIQVLRSDESPPGSGIAYMEKEDKALDDLLSSTIGKMFVATAGRFPEREVLVMPELDLRITYRDLLERVNRAAKGFIALGVKQGEHVAIWSPNRLEWYQTAYALWKIGVVVVSVNTLFKPPELSHVLGVSGCTTLVMAAGFQDQDYLGSLLQLAPEIPEQQAGNVESLKFPCLKRIVVLDSEPRPGMFSFAEMIENGKSVSDAARAERELAVKPDDPATMIFTSGTTGFPKGALLRHKSVLAQAYYSGRSMGLESGDRCLFPLPFFTIGGMQSGVVMPICHSITVISMQWFNPRKALQLMQGEGVTLAIMVNTMWVAALDLADFNEFDFSRLTRGFSAGAPCPTAMMKEIEQRFGITMTIGYGLSETTAVVVASDIADSDERRLASVGRPMPGVEGRVIDTVTGKVLPCGEQGEIVLRGWCIMIGYHNRPEATAETIDAQGWLHTGDLGFLDERGYLHVTGRLKDMIIRGGQNVYAKEIEDLLHTHPKIADGYIVGVPSRKYGEEILAAVKLRSGQAMTGEELREFCKTNIARYKVPRYVWFVETFPVNPMGKIQKFKLMDMAIAHFGLEAEKQGPTA